jgi:hypothetical protein
MCCGTNTTPRRHVADIVGQHVARLLPTTVRRRVCATAEQFQSGAILPAASTLLPRLPSFDCHLSSTTLPQ